MQCSARPVQREAWCTTGNTALGGGPHGHSPPHHSSGQIPSEHLAATKHSLTASGCWHWPYLIPTAPWTGTVGSSTATRCPEALLSLSPHGMTSHAGGLLPPLPQTPFVPQSLSSNYPYLGFQRYEQEHCRPNFSLSSRTDCIHIDDIPAALPPHH